MRQQMKQKSARKKTENKVNERKERLTLESEDGHKHTGREARGE